MRAAHETGPAHDALVIDTSRFWKWFDKAMKQCKRLQSYWDRGAICGFISRVDAEEALASCADGTCIVRLSESVPKAFAGWFCLLCDLSVHSLISILRRVTLCYVVVQ